jgi:hypothetical protein
MGARSSVARGVRLCAGLWALALVGSPAAGQQGEPIGSWWFLKDANGTGGGHAIMTLSTQGSGVIAFQCASGKTTVLLGLNKPELRRRSAGAARIEYQIGAGERHSAEARLTSEETVELSEPAATALQTQVAAAPSFTIHLNAAPDESASLVFRPVETAQAMRRLREACGSKP